MGKNPKSKIPTAKRSGHPEGEIMRISSKGQVTIPIKIREDLGLLPETEVRFQVEGNTLRLIPEAKPSRTRGQRLVDRIRGRAKSGMSTDEIMALTRQE